MMDESSFEQSSDVESSYINLTTFYKIFVLFCFSTMKHPNEGTMFKLPLDEFFTDELSFFICEILS